jgi:molybdopterin/thiamine biosynthesis adenylyltransferase
VLVDVVGGRYDRQELITWWDQSRLAAARVLVVGAGALGNELVKCLVLVGVGTVHVVDGDVIERSNLARCPFFTMADEQQPKAQVLARAAGRLNPDTLLTGFACRVQDLGVGAFADYDVVLGGLDNREARLWVNQACRKMGIPWVDGAIEGLRGTARVFLPASGACYECTLGEGDRAALAHRMSCALLSRSEMLEGKTPTTATSASVVAAVQAQEAIKLLAGRPDLVALAGKAWHFVGETMDSWIVEYGEDPLCFAHDTYESVIEVDADGDTTIGELLTRAGVTTFDTVELEDDLVLSASCRACASTTILHRRRSGLVAGDGECLVCREPLLLDVARRLDRDSPLLREPIRRLDLAGCDVITASIGSDRVHLLVRRAS